MTVIDKARLRQTIFDLIENDNSLPQRTEKDFLAKASVEAVDSICQAFLEGSLTIRYDPKCNNLEFTNNVEPDAMPRNVYQRLNIAIKSSFELSELGAKLAEKGFFDEAAVSLNVALKLETKNLFAHLNLGQVYIEKRILNKAMYHLNQVLKIMESDKGENQQSLWPVQPAVVQELIGRVYLIKRSPGPAIKHFKRALKLDPNQDAASFNLGIAFLNNGMIDESILQLKRALERNSGHAKFHKVLSEAYEKKALLDEAIRECTIAIELERNEGEYFALLGRLYYRKSLMDESIEAYQQAIKLSKDSNTLIRVHNNLGVAYAEKGLFEKAIREFKKTLQLDTADSIAKHNLGLSTEDLDLLGGKRKQLQRKTNTLKKTENEQQAEYVVNESADLIKPQTPIRNMFLLYEKIKTCRKYIHWMDLYFPEKGLQFLLESLSDTAINEIKILTALQKDKNYDYYNKFRSSFQNLEEQCKAKNVVCELRVITDNETRRSIHDRWILSENVCFNLPSFDTISRGQFSEIKKTKNRPPFNDWWTKGKDIITKWDEIIVEWNNIKRISDKGVG